MWSSCEIGIGVKFRDDGTERPPLIVVTACDGDPLVFSGAPIYAVRHHPGCRLPSRSMELPSSCSTSQGPPNDTLDSCDHFDEGTLSRSFPAAQRRHYRDSGVDGSDRVHQCHRRAAAVCAVGIHSGAGHRPIAARERKIGNSARTRSSISSLTWRGT